MDKTLIDELRKITEEEKEILEGNTEVNKKLYMNSSTMIVDSKKLLDNGRLIQIRPHTRFIHFPEHVHNYVEVVYMCEGSTHHIVNGEHVTLNKGELLFLNQNAKQEIMPAMKNDIAINFIIIPEFFDQALKMIGEEKSLIRDFLISCLKSKHEQIAFLHFKASSVLPIQNLIENMVWTIMNNEDVRSINQVTMGLLILQLMNHTDKVTSGSNYEQNILFTVLRYIEENYREGELCSLAEIMNCDMLWLSRMIKKLTGKTYTELIQKKRLDHAAFLLTRTNISIADIGYDVGYENKSYFYRIFKEQFAQTPRQYRVAQQARKLDI